MSDVRQVFDSWAGTERGESMAVGHDVLVNHILDRWDVSKIECLLDVGCGNGRALKSAQNRGVEKLSGADLSDNMIAEAKKNLPNADLHCGSIDDMHWWLAESFSHIMSIEALYYLSDLPKGLAELKRVLKPGGNIAIAIDYYKENKGTHTWQDAINLELKLLSSDEWVQLLREAGFTDVVASRINRSSNMQSESEFSPSPYFPSYEKYKSYKQEGALLLAN